jgi:hypothetical protein
MAWDKFTDWKSSGDRITKAEQSELYSAVIERYKAAGAAVGFLEEYRDCDFHVLRGATGTDLLTALGNLASSHYYTEKDSNTLYTISGASSLASKAMADLGLTGSVSTLFASGVFPSSNAYNVARRMVQRLRYLRGVPNATGRWNKTATLTTDWANPPSFTATVNAMFAASESSLTPDFLIASSSSRFEKDWDFYSLQMGSTRRTGTLVGLPDFTSTVHALVFVNAPAGLEDEAIITGFGSGQSNLPFTGTGGFVLTFFDSIATGVTGSSSHTIGMELLSRTDFNTAFGYDPRPSDWQTVGSALTSKNGSAQISSFVFEPTFTHPFEEIP